MLTDQSAYVGAVGSCFATEARRVGGVADRQIAPIEDLPAMQIGERHFGRRNQEKIPLAGDLEQVVFELRQIARAAQRVAVDEKRRLDLRVSVLTRMKIEHEVDERAREACASA